MQSKGFILYMALGLATMLGGCKKSSSTTMGGPVAMTTPAASPSVDPGAEAFVRGLYANYAASGDYSPMLHENEVFTPELLKMLKHDEKTTPKGEIGTIEADPICQCQDDGGMKLQTVNMVAIGPEAVDAHVTLLFDKPVTVTLKLAKVTGEGWRVDDAVGADGTSTRQLLKGAK